MVGLGETYFAAYALAANATEIAAGLVASIPMVIGGILQLTTPHWVARFRSHKKWAVTCAAFQASSLALLPLAVYFDQYAVAFIYLVATLYWTGGLGTNSVWSTWIEEIVPKYVRTHFFARRVRMSQACSLLGFIIAGVWLQFGKASDQVLLAFASIFLVASACRFISAACLATQSEPSSGRLTQSQIGLRQVLGRLRGHAGARLLWYLFAVQAAVQISGPYFSPFMFRQMHLSYVEFMMLVALGFIGKVISLPLWGRFAHRYGARGLLWIGGVMIVPVSGAWMGLWVVEQRYVWMAAVQLIGGIAWAAYELAFFLMFFEAIPRQERTSLLTLYNFGNALSLGIGSTCGAVFLATWGENFNSYLLLFGISSLLRGVALVLLARVPKPQTFVAELKEEIAQLAVLEKSAGPVVEPRADQTLSVPPPVRVPGESQDLELVGGA